MNGAHDLGGRAGFGPAGGPRAEPVFHAAWERRMCALMMAAGDVGGWSIDEDRAACEAMHPARYLKTSYYEHWLHGLEQLLRVHTPEGVPTRAAEVWALVTARGSYLREAQAPARFKTGDAVRAKPNNGDGHTRLPRYVQGCAGVVVRVHGVHVFPDSNAARRGEDPRWLYGVRFTSEELWGTAGSAVHLDLWEPYFEPA